MIIPSLTTSSRVIWLSRNTYPKRPQLLAACPALWVLLSLTAIVSARAETSDADEANIKVSGDLLQWGIPLVGWGLTYLFSNNSDAQGGAENNWAADFTPGTNAPGLNWPGPRLNTSPHHDFLVSFVRMEVTVYALKYAVNEQRPNGGPHSFPSGHTASAFMGAEFIRKNFGIKWGLPAYAAATWVGYSRVESHNHYWRDVLAGALVGIASNYDFDAIDTPIGKLSFGPALMPANQPTRWRCDATDDLTCTENVSSNQLALVPGLQINLRF